MENSQICYIDFKSLKEFFEFIFSHIGKLGILGGGIAFLYNTILPYYRDNKRRKTDQTDEANKIDKELIPNFILEFEEYLLVIKKNNYKATEDDIITLNKKFYYFIEIMREKADKILKNEINPSTSYLSHTRKICKYKINKKDNLIIDYYKMLKKLMINININSQIVYCEKDYDIFYKIFFIYEVSLLRKILNFITFKLFSDKICVCSTFIIEE